MKEYRFRLENPGEASLASLVERLGAIIAYYRPAEAPRYRSTHERTKEVWGALQALLRLSEKKWEEWIPLLVEQYSPDFPSPSDNEYFKKLLSALLERFANEVKGYTPAMKRLLARSIRSALDSASASPYPQLCFFVKEFHPDRLCDPRFKEKCMEVIGCECK